MRAHLLAAALLLVSILPSVAAAHPGPHALTAAAAPAQGDRGPLHRVEKLADGVFVIFGPGGNVGLVVGPRYAVLVDDEVEGFGSALLKVVRGITKLPVKYVINTHHHPDHTGNNAVIERQAQVIVAHANAWKRLEAEQAQRPAAQRGGLPELALGEPDPAVKARLDLHLGTMDLHLVHFAAGHTDNDVLVGIPARSVLFTGDLFVNGLTPYIDVAAGGSLAGVLANVDWLLAWLPDGVKLVPGHGPVGTKEDLLRYRAFLRAVERHLQANPGKSGKELAASFDRSAFPDVHDLPGFLTWEAFFDAAAGRSPST